MHLPVLASCAPTPPEFPEISLAQSPINGAAGRTPQISAYTYDPS